MQDGFIINEELNQWVHNSLMSVDMDETKERFDEIDIGKIIKFCLFVIRFNK
jgi:hypothetical protein